MKQMRKNSSLLLAAAMCLTSAAGCTSSPSSSAVGSSGPSAPANSSSASGETPSTTSEAFSYPMPGNITLTYFGQLHSKVSKDYSSYADLEVVRWWFEKTGVSLEFETPPSGMEKEQFNILLASGDYPDLLNYKLVEQPGGTQKLHDDGVLIDLTEDMQKYMPNLMAYYAANPHMERQVKDDNGRFFVIPFLEGGGVLLATTGPMIRQDILEQLSITPPETISDWDGMLKEMKEAYPDHYPLTGGFVKGNSGLRTLFQPAYGVGKDNWYVDTEKKVHFAPLENGYREFLMQLNDWYNKGYLDANFATLDQQSLDNNMSSGKSFATFGAGSSGLGAYMNANKDNPSYQLMGVKIPTMNPGEQAKYVTEYEFGGNPQLGITTACKNVEAAMRLYDFGFSEEGYRRFNWGEEGVSYTMENGKPQYTELILKNPEGKSVDTVLANFAMTAIKGPAMLVQDPEYMLQYYSMPQQQQAMEAWEDKDYENRSFPTVSYTSEESQQLTAILADLETYVEQTSMKFIIGTESFDNWDNFVKTCSSMNVENAIQIQQAAVDRYNSR